MAIYKRLLEALVCLTLGIFIGASLFAPQAESGLSPGSVKVRPIRTQEGQFPPDSLAGSNSARNSGTPKNPEVFEVDKKSWYRTQKNLQAINPVPVFDWQDLKLSKKLCEALEIKPDEKDRLDAVLGLSMNKIIECEKRNASLKTSLDGEVLEVAPYAGDHLKEDLFQAIAGIIQEPASTTLQALLESDRLFGGFGQFRQEIWLQEPFDGNSQGDSPLYLYAMYYDAHGHPTSGLNARAMSRRQYVERYGLALGKGQ